MSTHSGLDLTEPSVADSQDQGTVVHLHDVNGDLMYYGEGDEKKPVTWKVVGVYSNIYQKAEQAVAQRQVKRRRRSTPAEMIRDQLELMFDCSLGWDGVFEAAGKPLQLTKDNVIRVLTRNPWIKSEDLDPAMSDPQRFSKKS